MDVARRERSSNCYPRRPNRTVKRAIAALQSLGFDRPKVTYDLEAFQLLVDTHGACLGSLQAQSRMVWPWQRSAVAAPDRSRTAAARDRRLQRQLH